MTNSHATLVDSPNYRILVINMAKNPDRKQYMQQQLACLGLAYNFIQAVDGAAIPADVMAAYRNHTGVFFKPLTTGEVGCYLSHIKAAQFIVDNCLDYALILEDDVTIKPELAPLLTNNTLNTLYNWKAIKVTTAMGRRVVGSINLHGNQKLVRYNKPPKSTLGYFLSLAGAQSLLNNFNGVVTLPIDMQFQHFWLGGFDSLGLTPHLVYTTEPFSSQIGQARKLRKTTLGMFIAKMRYKIHYFISLKLAFNKLPLLKHYLHNTTTNNNTNNI